MRVRLNLPQAAAKLGVNYRANKAAGEGFVPLRRQGLPEDVSDAVLYIASGTSSYITGANFDINGGMAFS